MPKIVRQVAERIDESINGDQHVGTPMNIGALFRDVIDLRPAQIDSKGDTVYPADPRETGYTLAQFIDHYMDFMRSVPFIYIGNNQVDNNHIGIFIDTSCQSSSEWDIRSDLLPAE